MTDLLVPIGTAVVIRGSGPFRGREAVIVSHSPSSVWPYDARIVNVQHPLPFRTSEVEIV